MPVQIVSHTTQPSESVQRLKEALNLQPEPNVLHYGQGVDKLTQYKFFEQNGVNALPYTTDAAMARQWLADGSTVMCRSRIKGQTGSGIQVVNPGQELPEAKVFTKYLSHKREFRVNMLRGEVVNIREKLRQEQGGDFHIRNHANGYTTAHARPMGDATREKIYNLAKAACKVSASDFIGVDIGYNEAKDTPFVIEVNSGPSIEGSSVREYTAAIRRLFNME
jgi:predicted ATP-grasp superfamily ATP-dependent carboligase